MTEHEKLREEICAGATGTVKELAARKSVRVFEEREIPADVKRAILFSAAEAPTAGNQQLYTVIDVTDEEKKQRLSVLCDNQPFIAKALELRPPYPSLAATLSSLSLNTEENRHNALSDAEDTARLLAYLEQREEGRIRSLFADGNGAGTSEAVCTTAVGAFRQAKKRRLSCPVCGDRLGTGMWYVLNGTEQIGVCSCERDGKFLCLLNAAEENGAFNVSEAFVPFTDEEQRRRYENARRAARNRYR